MTKTFTFVKDHKGFLALRSVDNVPAASEKIAIVEAAPKPAKKK